MKDGDSRSTVLQSGAVITAMGNEDKELFEGKMKMAKAPAARVEMVIILSEEVGELVLTMGIERIGKPGHGVIDALQNIIMAIDMVTGARNKPSVSH